MNTRNLSTRLYLALSLLIVVMVLGCGPIEFGVLDATAEGADAVDGYAIEVGVEATASPEAAMLTLAPTTTLAPVAIPAPAEWPVIASQGFEEGMGAWVPSGSQMGAYKVQIDSSISHSGVTSGMIQSIKTVPEGGFATWTREIPAEEYRGKKIRITAFIRSEGVADFAGVWARIDGTAGVLSFVDSRSQPVRGSVDWTEVTITINVPQNGHTFLFGAILEGDGQIWVDDITLEVVN